MSLDTIMLGKLLSPLAIKTQSQLLDVMIVWLFLPWNDDIIIVTPQVIFVMPEKLTKLPLHCVSLDRVSPGLDCNAKPGMPKSIRNSKNYALR
jgi:hypothetical protein